MFRIVEVLLPLVLLGCGGGDSDHSAESVIEVQSVSDGKLIAAASCGAELASIGVGAGTASPINDETEPKPPDLIVKKVWLETSWEYQVYRYGTTERIHMKAQIKNIGDGPPSQTVPGVFILSRGFVKDVQGKRRVVGSDETQPNNLGAGDTHTETESLDIGALGLTPGMWNIIYCVNRNRDDDTTSGAYEEKHKSNNCSTEAVFEVVEGTVNTPTIDFIVHGLTFLQAPTYVGDVARFGGFIKNQGTARPATDIRSSYTLSCNGGSPILLTDDATKTDEFESGESAWEETLTPVRMPDTPGSCTVTLTADYQGAVSESDEGNNIQSLTLTLLPRPLPDLIITYIGIGENNDTSIKKGNEKHPTLRIKNIGSGPVTQTTRQAYYWCDAAFQCTHLDGDDTEATKLCSGCETQESIDRSWSASKKGTFYLKACADYQESQSEKDERNNCLVSGAIVVK